MMDRAERPRLTACPCGEIPSVLCIDDDGHGGRWASACGDCCSEWSVEFRADYHPLESDEAMALACVAWNESPRAAALTDQEMQLDAARYRRLAWLVEFGCWSVGHHEIIGSCGFTKDTWMDDKKYMDAWLDKPEVVADADACAIALASPMHDVIHRDIGIGRGVRTVRNKRREPK